MAQSSFFGKRGDAKPEPTPAATPAAVKPATPAAAGTASASPAASGAAGAAPGVRPAGFFGPAGAAASAPASLAAGAHAADAGHEAEIHKESKLTVGPNIKLKGVEITDCDVLFIEGVVEATLDSKLFQISENGSFKGTANIDVAEIHGNFDGELTVRDKLTVFSSGKVTGKIRYGKLVVEEGARLNGEINTVAD